MIRRLARTAAILALLLTYGDGRQATRVGTGETGYGTRVSSPSFFGCTALGIDVGEEGVLVHAYPTHNRRPHLLKADQAVAAAERSLIEHGKSLEEATAFISAGNYHDLQTILQQLESRGVTVQQSSVDFGFDRKGRDVLFTPAYDRMHVLPPN